MRTDGGCAVNFCIQFQLCVFTQGKRPPDLAPFHNHRIFADVNRAVFCIQEGELNIRTFFDEDIFRIASDKIRPADGLRLPAFCDQLKIIPQQPVIFCKDVPGLADRQHFFIKINYFQTLKRCDVFRHFPFNTQSDDKTVLYQLFSRIQLADLFRQFSTGNGRSVDQDVVFFCFQRKFFR